MGMILIYSLIFLLIFLSIGIGLFIYSKRKKSKVGLTISVIMILLVILVLLMNTIDEFTISKKDITADLKDIDIELKDDFEITNNKVTGMSERIQETEIQVTQRDKDRIINEIKKSTNFQLFPNKHDLHSDSVIFNFKYLQLYSRERLLILDNIPTRIIVTIDENTNILKYQRIED